MTTPDTFATLRATLEDLTAQLRSASDAYTRLQLELDRLSDQPRHLTDADYAVWQDRASEASALLYALRLADTTTATA